MKVMRIGLKFLSYVVLLTALNGCGSGSPEHESEKQNPEETPAKRETPDVKKSKDAAANANALNLAVADFRGAVVIETLVNSRLLLPERPFSLGYFLGGSTFPKVEGLPELLGFQSSQSLNAAFRNGKPNAINMLLWDSFLSHVARQLAFQCGPEDERIYALQPNAKVAKAIQSMCAWPLPSARSVEKLRTLWNLTMSHDAPESEFQAFSAFFQGPSFAQVDGQEAAEALFLAMLFNPYFLLNQ